ARLRLSASSRLLDLGCGPCGPLHFVLSEIPCHGTGVDLSQPALAAGHGRAKTVGVESRLTLEAADLDEPLPFPGGAFDAAMSLDVILHLRDREETFREVARLLTPAGRFLFTDAGVVTGAVSDREILRRSAHGDTQFSGPGFNERMLERAGLRLLDREDR